MEHKLPSVPPAVQQKRNQSPAAVVPIGPGELPNPPDSFDCLISYETDIRTWKSVSTISKSKSEQYTVDPLADLRVGTSQRRTSARFPLVQNFTRAAYINEGDLPKSEEVPVRDRESALRRPTSLLNRSSSPKDDDFNLLFSPDSLPVSPSQSPVGSSDFRTSCSDSEQIISGDQNTARYLRILKPHKDSASDVEEVCSPPSLGTSLNISETDPFDANPSSAENLLLESPSSSPSHFSRLRLSLSTGESETDASLAEPNAESISRSPLLHQDTSHHPQLVSSATKRIKLQDVPKNRVSAKRRILPDSHHKTTQSVHKLPETAFHIATSEDTVVLDKAVIHNLESEIKRLVVDIYSEKPHQFVPIPGLRTTRMDHQEEADASHGSEKDAWNSSGKTALNLSFGLSPGQTAQNMSDELLKTPPSSTSDALALQRSVIGDSMAEPASMEEIAAAIEEAQKQYRERLDYHRQQSTDGVETDLQANAKRSHNGSISSLDETPTRIPAPSQSETASDAEQTHNHLADSDHNDEDNEQQHQNPKAVTVSKRPTSLVVQNTGLAISSAVAGRFGAVPSTEKPHQGDQTLYRSPVQAITTSKGGKSTLVAQKPDAKKSKKKQGKKEVSATPGDVQVKAAAEIADHRETSSNASTPPGKIVTVKAAGDSAVSVQQIGLEPATGMIITGGQSSDGEQARPGTNQTNTGFSSGDEEKPKQQNSSFLGSLFPWGRRNDPGATKTPASQSPGSVHPEEGPKHNVPRDNKGAAQDNENFESTAMAESTDSGIDIVPTNSSAVEVFHADFSPVHSSTPMQFQPDDFNDSPQTHGSSENALNISYGADATSVDRQRDTNSGNANNAGVRTNGINADTETPRRKTSGGRKLENNVGVDNQQLQGRPAPLVGMRRRDFSKLPSTSLSKPNRTVTASRSEPLQHSRGGGDEVQMLMRAKAKLEGQLESMGAETAAALQDRANLQSQVAAMQVQLQSYSTDAEMADAERSAMETNLRSVDQHRAQLEQAVVSLQASLEGKEDALDGLRQDLETSSATNQRLQEKLHQIRAQMDSKQSNLDDMKDKIRNLQGEVEKAHQEKADSIAELKVLQSDVQSLVQSKEWFQEQLQFAQDARNKLQQDLRNAQTQVKSQTKAVENLKAENAQVRQELNKTRQQALQEKEQIAKHLETIEADMVAREAAFGAIEREKLAVQEAVAARMDQMQEERHQLGNLIATTVELERHLESAQKELGAKKDAMKALDAEKSELAKELTLAQDAVNTRERELSTLQHRYDDIEDKLNDLLNESNTQDDAMHQLQQEKSHLEAALSTANAEKRAIDGTLQNLRKDMGQVENSFKQMRQELGQKSDDLENAQREKEQLVEQLAQAERQLQDQERHVEHYSTDLESKNDLVDELVGVKSALEKELQSLKEELQSLKNSENNTKQAKKGIEVELRKVRDDFKDIESQLQEALTENAHFEGQLEMMADEQQRFSHLLDENGALKQKIAELQSATHRELGDQKAQILRLGSDLSNTQKELKTKQKTYESATSTLTRKLKEAMEAKQAAERDIQALQNNAARTSKEDQDRLMAELDSARKGLSVVQDQRDKLEQELRKIKDKMEEEVGAYREKVADLEEELKNLKDLCEEQQRNEDANRKTALELEREKGRLAGVQQSHHALKQHTSLLEAALGRRETSLAEMSAQLTNSSHERASEEDKLRTQLRLAEDALRSEKHTSKDLRKQLATEKGDLGRHHRELQSKSMELDEMKKDLERKSADADTAKSDLDRVKEVEEKQKSEMQALRNQLDESKEQLEKLKRHFQQAQAKDPVVQDRIKSLTWENEQKTQDVEAMKEQLELAERRQQIELDAAQSAVQMSKDELKRIKAELGNTRKEKFAYQTKVGQLKGALKATLQQNKLLKAKLKAKSKGNQPTKSTDGKASPQPKGATTLLRDDIVVPEIAYDVESLLAKDDMDPMSSTDSKPLQSLQGCMSSLKDQMGDLQQQMAEHTAAVNTSNEAWREVENKVRDLRKACTPPPSSSKPQSAIITPSKRPNGVDQQSSSKDQVHTTPKSSMSTPSLPNVQDL